MGKEKPPSSWFGIISVSIFVGVFLYIFIASFDIGSSRPLKFKDTGNIEDMTDEEINNFQEWKDNN